MYGPQTIGVDGMGRKPKVRESYYSDAAFLTRLAQAVEEDPKGGKKFKTEAVRLLNETARHLLVESSRRLAD